MTTRAILDAISHIILRKWLRSITWNQDKLNTQMVEKRSPSVVKESPTSRREFQIGAVYFLFGALYFY